MGLFSGIVSGVKSIVRGVGKAFKSVGDAVKGVVKGVRNFLGSNIGKFALAAAAIWLGGAALGYWNTGFSSIDGALAASQTAAASPAATELAAAGGNTAATQAVTGAGTAATDAAASAATGGLSAPAATQAASAVAPGAGAYGELSGVTGYSLAPEAGGSGLGFGGGTGLVAPSSALNLQAASPGLMAKAGGVVKGAASWMADHPIPTLVGGQMLAGAFSPNELDLAEAQNKYKIEEEQRQQALIDAANARIAKVGSIPTYQWSGQMLPPVTTPQVQIPQAGIMGRRVTLS